MSENLITNSCIEANASHQQTIGSANRECTEVTKRAEQESSDPVESVNSFFQRKYIVDRLLGGVLLILTSPLTLALFALVKLTSPGPAFYRQERVGLNGKSFHIIKLRSMIVDAESDGNAVWSVKNDARVTGLGRILRRLHLDELPQLFNVLKGEMSLIGPRPERQRFVRSWRAESTAITIATRSSPGLPDLHRLICHPTRRSTAFAKSRS